MAVAGIWSFVDHITDLDPEDGWTVSIVPGEFKYECTEPGATLLINRVDPHEDVAIGPCGVGESVAQVGSVAVHEKP